MSKVHVELRNGVAFAYLDHRPLRVGDRVHVSRRNRAPNVPVDAGTLQVARMTWTHVELESEHGARYRLRVDEAYLVREP